METPPKMHDSREENALQVYVESAAGSSHHDDSCKAQSPVAVQKHQREELGEQRDWEELNQLGGSNTGESAEHEPPQKRASWAEKGKEVAIEVQGTPSVLPQERLASRQGEDQLSPEDQYVMDHLPNFLEPRLPDVSNDFSVLQESQSNQEYQAFAGIVFPSDQRTLNGCARRV